MITFEEAKQIAIDKIGSDYGLLEDSIIEKPYGWYFSFQSKKYLATGNISDMLSGSGGFIVEKVNGKIVEFGSAYSVEKNFEIYEKGLLGKFDLIITEVKDVNLAVRLLKNLRMTYIESELAHGVEWKIHKKFDEKQIKSALSNLPHTFQNQNFYFLFDVFEQIDNSKCLIYELKRE